MLLRFPINYNEYLLAVISQAAVQKRFHCSAAAAEPNPEPRCAAPLGQDAPKQCNPTAEEFYSCHVSSSPSVNKQPKGCKTTSPALNTWNACLPRPGQVRQLLITERLHQLADVQNWSLGRTL